MPKCFCKGHDGNMRNMIKKFNFEYIIDIFAT